MYFWADLQTHIILQRYIELDFIAYIEVSSVVYFVLKPVCDIWDNSQHEPLSIFISFSLSRHGPWRRRNTQSVVDLARALRELLEADIVHKWYLLVEFLCLARQLETMPESVLRGMVHTMKVGCFTVRLPKEEIGNSLVNEELSHQVI
jgi:hypothetical protein